MKFAAMICSRRIPALIGCGLVVAVTLGSSSTGAQTLASAGIQTPAAVQAPAAAAVPAPALTDTRPVLERWAQAVAQRLAQTDANAPPIAPPVGPGQSLKPGGRGDRVDRLAAQLKARGFLATDAYHGVYDLAMEAAVAAYQANEGILADGVAGEGTVDSLDRDAAANIRALKSTLDGMRALAAEAPSEFFLVNIPSQTAYLIQGSTVAMSMRTAVGRPSRPTPLLNDHVTDVVINPTWTAPTTVLAKDKLPSLRRTRHPGIEGATIYLDKIEVDPATVDWTTVTPERIRIVQSPGDQNALGRFKFNLTNGQSIYMHDTNDHSVFARQGRALSSGCVRLADPRRLAETLLGRDGWTSDRIDHALDSERTQYIGLRHSLPVRMVYWQASVDDAGIVRIHKDIYGQNSPALAANPRHQQAVQIAPPRPLIVGRPAGAIAPAPAPEPTAENVLEDFFTKLMAYVPTRPTLPTAHQATSSEPTPLEQVAVQDVLPPADGAHCTESCGWGLY